MQNSQPTHTEEEIRSALESATVHTAIQLWEKKDWETYKTRRDLLIALIGYRNGYQNNAAFTRAFGRRFGARDTSESHDPQSSHG